MIVAPDRIEFPRVTLGDTTQASVQIGNGGDAVLRVEAIDLPPGGSVFPRPPFEIEPDSSLRLVLEYAAIDTTTEGLALTVRSNAANGDVSAAWNVDVLPLHVQTVALTTQTPAPLGEPIVVQSFPFAGVRIESMELRFRSGLLEDFDPIPMVRIGMTFVGVIPGVSVQEGGVEFYVVARNSGFEATDPPEGESRPMRIDVESPNVLTFEPMSNDGFVWRVGESVDFRMELARGTRFESGTLHYRRGGDTEWQSADILEQSFTGVNATIPGDQVGPTGVQYWAEVRTLTATLTDPSLDPEREPREIQVSIDNLVEPSVHPGERYRLFSAPLRVPQATHLGAMLADHAPFGPAYDPTRWRAFRYEPSAGNIEYSASSSNFFVTPGAAFWLISRDPHQIDTTPVPGVSTPLGAPEAIYLAPGWNAVGSPYAFPVPRTQLVHSDSVSDPVAFDPGRNDYVDAPPDSLRPFEGYFIENTSSRQETLLVHPRPLEARGLSAEASSAPAVDLALEARGEGGHDAANRIGIAAGAAEERDRFDASEPPAPPGSTVRLAIANRGWHRSPGLYRRDFRPPADGHVWDLEIAGASGHPVELAIRPERPLPSGLSLRLLDREQETIVVPARGGDGVWRHTVLATGEARPYRIAIAIGSAEYLEAIAGGASIPSRVSLDPVAPNPARGALRLRFGLPAAVPVRLEVFDASGRRVATLLDGRALPAGRHSVVWPGTRDGGGRAPSGVYFHRLTAGNERRTVRSMLLQ